MKRFISRWDMDGPCHQDNDRTQKRFKDHDWILECVETANGHRQIRVICSQCKCHDNWLPHYILLDYGIDPWTLPINRSLRSNRECCVEGCLDTRTELHHFAPKRVFKNEANDWPVLPLCTDHHAYWHRLMGNYTLNDTER